MSFAGAAERQERADGVSRDRPDRVTSGSRRFGTRPARLLLHDGRTADLGEAIRAHANDGSEANGVINSFNTLFHFLRSL